MLIKVGSDLHCRNALTTLSIKVIYLALVEADLGRYVQNMVRLVL